jgi:hypothetical protein
LHDREVLPRRLAAPLVVLLLSGVACSSSDDTAAPTSTASGSATTATAPALPPGGTDCGTADLMSGWPTTIAFPPTAFTCIADAVASGTPARMVVVSAGDHSSGRQTSDGYDIPTHHVVTWIVLDVAKVQQTTDLSEDGGPVTTVVCTGLSEAAFGSIPVGTGCEPA